MNHFMNINITLYPTGANTIQIYRDLVQLFVQWKTCLLDRSAHACKTITLPSSIAVIIFTCCSYFDEPYWLVKIRYKNM